MVIKVLTEKKIIHMLRSIDITNFITEHLMWVFFIVLLCVLMYYCDEELELVIKDEYSVWQNSEKTICTI